MSVELTIKHDKGEMILYLNEVFQVKNNKLHQVMHCRKVLKLIFNNGSKENIEQLQKFFENQMPQWLVEFNKFN